MHASFNRTDPTATQTLRRRYAQALRGQLRKLNAAIRRGIEERDVLQLRADNAAPKDPDDPPVFRYPTDDGLIDAFIRWLKKQLSAGFLNVVGRGHNKFVREGYERGLEHATDALEEAGVEADSADVSTLMQRPVHRDELQTLYTRNYELLDDISEDIANEVRDELATGMAEGENPRTIARSLTDRVDSVGKWRSTVLARSEIINAHSTSALARFEEAGMNNVTVQAEWLSAEDERVCPICEELDGNVYSIEEVRNGTFEFTPDDHEADHLAGEYRIKPPAHPQCRCSITSIASVE